MNWLRRLAERYEDWRRKVEQGVMFEVMDIQRRVQAKEEAQHRGFVVIENEKALGE